MTSRRISTLDDYQWFCDVAYYYYQMNKGLTAVRFAEGIKDLLKTNFDPRNPQ